MQVQAFTFVELVNKYTKSFGFSCCFQLQLY